MDTINNILIKLIRSELCQIPSKSILTNDESELLLNSETITKLYNTSSSHDLSHVIGAALYKLDLSIDSAVLQKFKMSQRLAVYRYEQLTYALETLYSLLAEIDVKYIPLKGSFIRQYYPSPNIRTSCDIDILVSQTDLDIVSDALTNKFNYTKIKEGPHDIHFVSAAGIHLELHFTLINEKDHMDIANLLSKVWDNTIPSSKYPCQYNITPEFAYFYHIAHMVKHFLYGGCGIRTFMDLWILNHNCSELDRKKAETLLYSGEIQTFEKYTLLLSEVWFSDITPEADCIPLLEQIEMYIFRGGIYGNVENRVKLNRLDNKNNIQFILSRLFLPYDHLKYDYPLLKKHKSLLPFYQVHRWTRLLSKKTSHRILNELKINRSITDDGQYQVEKMLSQLGLKQ